jgi:ABC-type glycerol-3-phosphate transport system substrate-binding protein
MGKVQVNRADGSCFAITAQSKNPEEAWRFVRFLAGPDSLGVNMLLDLQQMVPALTDYQKSDRFLKPVALTGVNKTPLLLGKANLFSMYDPLTPNYDEIASAENAELGEVWNGKATAKQAIERLLPKINAILAKK